MVAREGPWIQTYSGRSFYLLDPSPEDVDIADVAHALANLCRYTGHCLDFYSVAQHCVHVSEICDPNHALDGLLHDAAEAYVTDLSTPLKSVLPQYRLIEAGVHAAIAERFGIDSVIPSCVRRADRAVLFAEVRDNMGPSRQQWDLTGSPAPGLLIRPWSPDEAKGLFLTRFEELAFARYRV